MRRILAIMFVLLLAFSPAFAQTATPQGSGNQNSQTGQQNVPDGQTPDGLDTYAQDVPPPPPPNYTGLIIGGLAVGGLVTGIVLATQNNNNNTNTTTTPASP